jgi:D-alanyl-D-alanine carboxypeptidase
MGSGPPLLSGGRKRRRRRSQERFIDRRPRRGRRASRLILGALGIAVVAVLALSLVDALTNQSEEEPTAARLRQNAQNETLESAKPPWQREGSAVDDRFAVHLSRPDAVHLRFVRKPRAGLLFDVKSGRVLWRLKPERRLPIASLTKMMTALVVVERQDPHERVEITKEAVTTGGSGVGVLPKGKKVQLEALLNGLLLVSGNDAAVALARHAGGSVRRFVRLMNRRAATLGLSCTRFSTPHGLRDEGNHSCATDLATLARADLSKRRIRRIAARRRAVLKFPIKGGKLFLYNNNPLMRSGYTGVTGLKTGYTDRAGRSIVATAKRGHRELGVVLLHSYNPSEQAARLLNRGFRTLGAG